MAQKELQYISFSTDQITKYALRDNTVSTQISQHNSDINVHKNGFNIGYYNALPITGGIELISGGDAGLTIGKYCECLSGYGYYKVTVGGYNNDLFLYGYTTISGTQKVENILQTNYNDITSSHYISIPELDINIARNLTTNTITSNGNISAANYYLNNQEKPITEFITGNIDTQIGTKINSHNTDVTNAHANGFSHDLPITGNIEIYAEQTNDNNGVKFKSSENYYYKIKGDDNNFYIKHYNNGNEYNPFTIKYDNLQYYLNLGNNNCAGILKIYNQNTNYFSFYTATSNFYLTYNDAQIITVSANYVNINGNVQADYINTENINTWETSANTLTFYTISTDNDGNIIYNTNKYQIKQNNNTLQLAYNQNNTISTIIKIEDKILYNTYNTKITNLSATNLYFGNNNTLITDLSTVAVNEIKNNQLNKYLPLTGGTITDTLKFDTKSKAYSIEHGTGSDDLYLIDPFNNQPIVIRGDSTTSTCVIDLASEIKELKVTNNITTNCNIYADNISAASNISAYNMYMQGNINADGTIAAKNICFGEDKSILITELSAAAVNEIKNSKITITQGNNSQYFTLNQSEDKTITLSAVTKLSELNDDSTHRLVTDILTAAWNNKVDKRATGFIAVTNYAGTIAKIAQNTDYKYNGILTSLTISECDELSYQANIIFETGNIKPTIKVPSNLKLIGDISCQTNSKCYISILHDALIIGNGNDIPQQYLI